MKYAESGSTQRMAGDNLSKQDEYSKISWHAFQNLVAIYYYTLE
jgi:hypothetical protein